LGRRLRRRGVAAPEAESVSVRLMGAVFDLRIPATEKLVLLAMADHARDDGTGCYPSVGTLASKTSQSRRGVQGIMRRLEQAGLIVPSKVSHGRFSTEYRIVLGNRAPGSLFSPVQPRTPRQSTANLTASNREPDSKNRQRILMETSRTVNEPEREKDRAGESLPDWIPLRPWLEYREMRQKIGRPLTSAAVDLIIRDLLELRGRGQDVQAVLEQSIRGSHVKVFEVKNGTNSGGRKASGAIAAPAGKYADRKASVVCT